MLAFEKYLLESAA